jgi:tetratricopeptide (TPR) repeat protein
VLHRELAGLSRPALALLEAGDAADPEVAARLTLYEDNRRTFMDLVYTDLSEDPWKHPIYKAKRDDWIEDEDISVSLGKIMTGYAERLYLEARKTPPGEERRRKVQNILQGYTEALSFTELRVADVENLAVLYRDIGEVEAALATLDAGLERGYESVGIHDIRGGLLYALAKEEAAEAEAAGEDQPGAGGHIDAADEYLEEASTAYARATELDPENVSHWLRLGAIRWALGDHEGSRASWQRVLVIDPDNESARRGLAALGD